MNLVNLNRHDREILRTGIVGETHGRPQNQVLVTDIVLTVGPGSETAVKLRLVGKLTGSVQLVVLVLGDPVGVGGEAGTLGVERVVVGNEHLCGGHGDLVSNGLLGDGVDLVLIDNLELTVVHGVLIQMARLLNICGLGNVTDMVRVEALILGQGLDFLVHDRVLVTTNGRVKTEGKHVLVVGGNDTGSDNGAPGDNDIVINGHGGQDTSGSDSNVNATSLVENVLDNVLVVGDSGNGLEDKDALATDTGQIVSVVHVLKQQTIVLLVHADNVLELDGGTLGVGNDTVKVANGAETVAAQRELVGRSTKTNITEIKGLLAVEGAAGVTVGDSHFRQRNSVKQVIVLKLDIVQNKTLAVVEANAHGPALPFNLIALGGEGSALRLLDNQGLETGTGLEASELGSVLDSGVHLVLLGLGKGLVNAGGQVVHADKLLVGNVKDGRKLERQRVVVGFGVVVLHDVHVKLDQGSLFIGIVGSVNPGVANSRVALGELELFNLLDNNGVLEAVLLELGQGKGVERALNTVGELKNLDNLLCRSIDKSLVGLVDADNGVVGLCDSGNVGQRSTGLFGSQVVQNGSLGRLIEVDYTEVEVLAGERGRDEGRSDGNLIWGTRVKRMEGHFVCVCVCV